MSDAGRSQRAHAIFSDALGREQSERNAFITDACGGDVALEKCVRRLMRAAARTGGFLETAIISEPEPPDAVGNYLVVGVLGAGGMAVVYEALQENPRRRVALKVMRQAVGGSEAILRFRMETDALARLRHPGIAQIYEAGAAPLGLSIPSPFFAMELVPDAKTITDYAVQHGLSLRERLALFATVCDAVLHGHQNGIIHRDIKPGNVLVGPDGVAKVIDFGIARATDPHAARLTLDSDTRRLIGTLSAMSPEQCTRPGDVDVRTDVYSLGVLLYELVTGRPPHDLSHLTIPEAVRTIVEVSPTRPRSINPHAAGDLDAIIIKAMEKDRTRRYAGAGELAADVRRHLASEPIEARTSSAFDRARKFARRNPPLAAAIGVTLLTLIAGILVSSRLAYSAAKARDAAVQRGRELEQVISFQESLLRGIDVAAMGEQMRSALLSSLERAAQEGPSGGDAAEADFDSRFERVNFTTLASRTLHAAVLSRYHASIDSQFAAEPRIRARLLQQLADTMNTLGINREAEPVLRDALRLRLDELGPNHEDTLQSAHSLGSLLTTLGRYDEALLILRDTHDRRSRTLGADHHATLRTGTSLGGAYRRAGDAAEAERVWSVTLQAQRRVLGADHKDTLRTLNNLGVAAATQGKLEMAETLWRELLERRRRVYGADSPEYLGSLGNLGALLTDMGRYAEARPLIEESLAADRRKFGDKHETTLVSVGQLGLLLHEVGELETAEQFLRECAETRRHVLGDRHPDTLRTLSSLAEVMFERGKTGEASRLLAETLLIQTTLLGPAHIDTVHSLAASAKFAWMEGRIADAIALATAAADHVRTSMPIDAAMLGKLLSVRGEFRASLGEHESARVDLLSGYDSLSAALGADHPHTRRAAGRLASYYRAVAQREPNAVHAAEAESWQRRTGEPEEKGTVPGRK